MFSDPKAWREGSPDAPTLDPTAKALLESWGGVLEEARPCKESPEELERIQAAAARANRFKRRR